MTLIIRRILTLIITTLLVSPVWAQEAEAEGGEGGEEAHSPPSAVYIPIKPSFIVNFGGPGRMRYIKADITLRVKDTISGNKVRHHLPYIRNNLVLLLSKQTEEAINTQQGKEILRKAALAEVHSVLEAEEGESGVVDLYFDNFIVQR